MTIYTTILPIFGARLVPVKFLCGRPGCGQESTATLQIDAVSSIVSLVDPRTSRDGVPLCARHSDATTPPIGWAMNDLRSTSQAIDGGDDGSSGISSTPPRVRPERIAERGAKKKMSRRQSIAERARQEAVAKAAAVADDDAVDTDFHDGESVDDVDGIAIVEAADHSSDSSEDSGDQTLFDDEVLNAKLARRAARRGKGQDGPDSRPSRRRELDDDEAESGEDRFPWHFQFDEDDEPEELQASTPLLSRAFRATTG